jgi:hypothetical protein
MNARQSMRSIVPILMMVAVISLCGCNGDNEANDNATDSAGGASGGGSGGAAAVADRSNGAATSADDKTAAAFVQSKIDEHWLKTADGWVTQMHRRNVFGEEMEGVPEVLYLQYRDMKFSVKRVTLTESQKLNGTTYRAEITFEYVPTRRFHTERSMSAPPGWSRWDEEQPAEAIVVELRHGKWLMTDAELFAWRKPDPAAIPK